MKKAKIFLTALAVLAVVGGALAFKAKNQVRFAVCDVNAIPVPVCTSLSFLTTQTTVGGTISVDYDEYNKPCKLNKDGVLSCFTSVKTTI